MENNSTTRTEKKDDLSSQARCIEQSCVDTRRSPPVTPKQFPDCKPKQCPDDTTKKGIDDTTKQGTYAGDIELKADDTATSSSPTNAAKFTPPSSCAEILSRPEGTEQQKDNILLRHWNAGNWSAVLKWIKSNPTRVTIPVLDSNNKNTTVLHKILANRNIDERTRLDMVSLILQLSPTAARIKNHHHSLPLHVAVRNNVRMDGKIRENVMKLLIEAYPEALTSGDSSRHTPLHVACLKWCSMREAKTLIELAPQAATMEDEKGWLPIHIACSRRCSPEKLSLLLGAFPECIDAKTKEGDTPLSIATKSATEKRPNNALIRLLSQKLEEQFPKEREPEVSLLQPTKQTETKAHVVSNSTTLVVRGPQGGLLAEPSQVSRIGAFPTEFQSGAYLTPQYGESCSRVVQSDEIRRATSHESRFIPVSVGSLAARAMSLVFEMQRTKLPHSLVLRMQQEHAELMGEICGQHHAQLERLSTEVTRLSQRVETLESELVKARKK